MPAAERLKHWTDLVLDTVFPRNCVWREVPVEARSPFRYLGLEAARLLRPIDDPACSKCGAALEGDALPSHGCGQCLESAFAFDRCVAAYRYIGPARAMIQALKYRDGTYLKEDIYRALAQQPRYLENLAGAVLVPVPISDRKREMRGFNQAEVITEAVLRFHLPQTTAQPLLVRKDLKDSQTRLNRIERLRNVNASFVINPHAIVDPDLRFVIVDDVFTTGSTAHACALTLKKAGARQVEVAPVCRG